MAPEAPTAPSSCHSDATQEAKHLEQKQGQGLQRDVQSTLESFKNSDGSFNQSAYRQHIFTITNTMIADLHNAPNNPNLPKLIIENNAEDSHLDPVGARHDQITPEMLQNSTTGHTTTDSQGRVNAGHKVDVAPNGRETTKVNSENGDWQVVSERAGAQPTELKTPDGKDMHLPEGAKNLQFKNGLPSFSTRDGVAVDLDKSGQPKAFHSGGFTFERHDDNKWYYHQDSGGDFVQVEVPHFNDDGTVTTRETGGITLGREHTLSGNGQRTEGLASNMIVDKMPWNTVAEVGDQILGTHVADAMKAFQNGLGDAILDQTVNGVVDLAGMVQRLDERIGILPHMSSINEVIPKLDLYDGPSAQAGTVNKWAAYAGEVVGFGATLAIPGGDIASVASKLPKVAEIATKLPEALSKAPEVLAKIPDALGKVPEALSKVPRLLGLGQDAELSADASMLVKGFKTGAEVVINDGKGGKLNFTGEVLEDGTRALVDSKGLKIALKGASPEFQAKMLREIEQLPEAQRQLLAEQGIPITIAKNMSDFDPAMSGAIPSGHDGNKVWVKGVEQQETWDDLEGAFAFGHQPPTVVITEETRTGATNRAEGVLRHEFGHSVDFARGSFSSTPEFEKAYESDLNHLIQYLGASNKLDDYKKLMYYVQDGSAGPAEAFADVYGALVGSSANPEQTEAFLQAFPEVAALIKKDLGIS